MLRKLRRNLKHAFIISKCRVKIARNFDIILLLCAKTISCKENLGFCVFR